jgi:regulator of sigma E protease
MLITILAFVTVLGVLIFVHELGHFATAKMVGIEVQRFSIGFGPRILGFTRGETEYVISLLPFGGYVKMAGMEEMEPIEGSAPAKEGAATADGGAAEGRRVAGPRDFESKSLPARMLVISAGVLMNFLFAILVFAASAFIWGVAVEPEARIPARPAAASPALGELPGGARVTRVGETEIGDWGDLRRALATAAPGPVTLSFEGAPPATLTVPAEDSLRIAMIQGLEPDRAPVVGQVIAGLPAEGAGLRPGDRIESVAGAPVHSWRDLVGAVEARPGEPTEIVAARAGGTIKVQVTPRADTVATADGGSRVVGRIGVGDSGVRRERPGLVGGIAHGVERTWGTARMIVDMLGSLFSGQASPRSLGGPIMIGQLSGQVARAGIEAFLGFMALFSVNLAVLNLLPIPVLDGGHLLFLAVEAVRGRALSVEARMRFTKVGFVLVLAIMAWAFANDVLRLFGI